MKQVHSIWTLIFILLTGPLLHAQFEIPDKPEVQTSVYDYVDLLNSIEEQSLEEKLIRYSDTTSTQIVLATIASTQGENILYLGANWAHEWGIGQEKEDNGVFILLARDDRKIAINTGYGVEHLLTDAMSRRIIERDIIPYFKQNDYYGGLNRGVDAIFEVLQGEYQAEPRQESVGPPIGLIIFLIVLFIIFVIAISKRKKGGGGGGYRDQGAARDIMEAIILSRAGRGSYRRSSGGFGGFGRSSSGSSGGFGGGFGGGGFGGGGASGGW